MPELCTPESSLKSRHFMHRYLLVGLTVCASILGAAPSTQAQTAEIDADTGNIILRLLPSDIVVLGFEAQGALRFNAAATGNLIRLLPGAGPEEVVPAQRDPTTVVYFSPTGLPAGTYLIEGLLPKGLMWSRTPTNMRLAFSYTPIGQQVVVPWNDYFFIIPEPTTLALAMTAFTGIVAALRRRK
jgi:hypothetical protein